MRICDLGLGRVIERMNGYDLRFVPSIVDGLFKLRSDVLTLYDCSRRLSGKPSTGLRGLWGMKRVAGYHFGGVTDVFDHCHHGRSSSRLTFTSATPGSSDSAEVNAFEQEAHD